MIATSLVPPVGLEPTTLRFLSDTSISGRRTSMNVT
nr:MAG TPA: hypothetical protein [Caudoviricetes sp.]